MLVVMSRGPTRRVRHLLASCTVSGQPLQAADHEADLRGILTSVLSTSTLAAYTWQDSRRSATHCASER